MPPRSLLSTRARAELFDIPTDPDGLMRHYLLSPSDRELIRTRRRDENRFGLAVRISLLRYQPTRIAERKCDHPGWNR